MTRPRIRFSRCRPMGDPLNWLNERSPVSERWKGSANTNAAGAARPTRMVFTVEEMEKRDHLRSMIPIPIIHLETPSIESDSYQNILTQGVVELISVSGPGFCDTVDKCYQ